jgi:hypothetical protein
MAGSYSGGSLAAPHYHIYRELRCRQSSHCQPGEEFTDRITRIALKASGFFMSMIVKHYRSWGKTAVSKADSFCTNTNIIVMIDNQ